MQSLVPHLHDVLLRIQALRHTDGKLPSALPRQRFLVAFSHNVDRISLFLEVYRFIAALCLGRNEIVS